jgi:hypothetical protein
MNRRIIPTLIGTMLAVFQTALSVPVPPAIGAVTVAAPIRINGVRIPSGAAIYSGDRIVTGPTGASIEMKMGQECALGSETNARFVAANASYEVRLERGKVAVIQTTNASIAVTAGGVKVESERANGSYEVTWNGETLQVLTRRGVTRVMASNRTVQVSAGKRMKAAVASGKATAIGGAILSGKWIVVAATAAATGLTAAYTIPGPTCVSSSQLTCP